MVTVLISTLGLKGHNDTHKFYDLAFGHIVAISTIKTFKLPTFALIGC